MAFIGRIKVRLHPQTLDAPFFEPGKPPPPPPEPKLSAREEAESLARWERAKRRQLRPDAPTARELGTLGIFAAALLGLNAAERLLDAETERAEHAAAPDRLDGVLHLTATPEELALYGSGWSWAPGAPFGAAGGGGAGAEDPGPYRMAPGSGGFLVVLPGSASDGALLFRAAPAPEPLPGLLKAEAMPLPLPGVGFTPAVAEMPVGRVETLRSAAEAAAPAAAGRAAEPAAPPAPVAAAPAPAQDVPASPAPMAAAPVVTADSSGPPQSAGLVKADWSPPAWSWSQPAEPAEQIWRPMAEPESELAWWEPSPRSEPWTATLAELETPAKHETWSPSWSASEPEPASWEEIPPPVTRGTESWRNAADESMSRLKATVPLASDEAAVPEVPDIAVSDLSGGARGRVEKDKGEITLDLDVLALALNGGPANSTGKGASQGPDKAGTGALNAEGKLPTGPGLDLAASVELPASGELGASADGKDKDVGLGAPNFEGVAAVDIGASADGKDKRVGLGAPNLESVAAVDIGGKLATLPGLDLAISAGTGASTDSKAIGNGAAITGPAAADAGGKSATPPRLDVAVSVGAGAAGNAADKAAAAHGLDAASAAGEAGKVATLPGLDLAVPLGIGALLDAKHDNAASPGGPDLASAAGSKASVETAANPVTPPGLELAGSAGLPASPAAGGKAAAPHAGPAVAPGQLAKAELGPTADAPASLPVETASARPDTLPAPAAAGAGADPWRPGHDMALTFAKGPEQARPQHDDTVALGMPPFSAVAGDGGVILTMESGGVEDVHPAHDMIPSLLGLPAVQQDLIL